ncbi:MAG TPA: hypothetical protein DCE41_02630 [Cytophagales bacterium]|nr:hypothetical protein [Cytophagales bacterium]HAA23626.1 hypothetical protein [Cytophagales bacterium]HAP58740.1 hypothetical protein [Cytophagales bacterium]
MSKKTSNKRALTPRLLAIFGLLLVCINPPLLTIFNQAGSVWGFPVLYLYIFAVWMVVIVALARVVHKYLKTDDRDSE